MTECGKVCRTVLLATSLSVLALGLSACGSAAPATEPPPTSGPTHSIDATPLTVLSIAGGHVFVMKPGETQWVSGEAGMTLETDYKIRTETDGHATITLFEGSTIELVGDTEISLAELNIVGTASHVSISQQLGKTVSRVKKLVDPESGFEIETPAAVASVRGTAFYVSVIPSGLTTVGTIEGLVGVVAHGVEVDLVAGTRTTVLPGSAPGQPEPDVTATAQTGTGVTPTSTPSLTPTLSPTAGTAKIGIVKLCNRESAYPGDNVTYTYQVSNEGDVPLKNITVADNKAGQPAYQSGDANADNILDAGEIWIYRADYTIKNGETGKLTNRATASGIGPDNKKPTAVDTATVDVTNIVVKITNLEPDQVVARNVTVSGTVNDPSITRAVMTVNGSSRDIDVIDGQFSAVVELADGVNVITVTVTKAGGISRSASVSLEPETPGGR